jgi:hypothetical protein
MGRGKVSTLRVGFALGLALKLVLGNKGDSPVG